MVRLPHKLLRADRSATFELEFGDAVTRAAFACRIDKQKDGLGVSSACQQVVGAVQLPVVRVCGATGNSGNAIFVAGRSMVENHGKNARQHRVTVGALLAHAEDRRDLPAEEFWAAGNMTGLLEAVDFLGKGYKSFKVPPGEKSIGAGPEITAMSGCWSTSGSMGRETEIVSRLLVSLMCTIRAWPCLTRTRVLTAS